MSDRGTLLLAELQGEEWGRKMLALGLVDSPKVIKAEFTFENISGNEAVIGTLDAPAILVAPFVMVTTAFDSDDTNNLAVQTGHPPASDGSVATGFVTVAQLVTDEISAFGMYPILAGFDGTSTYAPARVGAGPVRVTFDPGTPGDGFPSQGAALVVIEYIEIV